MRLAGPPIDGARRRYGDMEGRALAQSPKPLLVTVFSAIGCPAASRTGHGGFPIREGRRGERYGALCLRAACAARDGGLA